MYGSFVGAYRGCVFLCECMLFVSSSRSRLIRQNAFGKACCVFGHITLTVGDVSLLKLSNITPVMFASQT